MGAILHAQYSQSVRALGCTTAPLPFYNGLTTLQNVPILITCVSISFVRTCCDSDGPWSPSSEHLGFRNVNDALHERLSYKESETITSDHWNVMTTDMHQPALHNIRWCSTVWSTVMSILNTMMREYYSTCPYVHTREHEAEENTGKVRRTSTGLPSSSHVYSVHCLSRDRYCADTAVLRAVRRHSKEPDLE